MKTTNKLRKLWGAVIFVVAIGWFADAIGAIGSYKPDKTTIVISLFGTSMFLFTRASEYWKDEKCQTKNL